MFPPSPDAKSDRVYTSLLLSVESSIFGVALVENAPVGTPIRTILMVLKTSKKFHQSWIISPVFSCPVGAKLIQFAFEPLRRHA